MPEQPAFDRVGNEFVEDYYNSVRGYVRQELTRRNLLKWLMHEDIQGGRLIDVGAGDGRDAAWLRQSGFGFQSTLVDESSKMLKLAKAQVPGAKIIHGSVHDVLAQRPKLGRFNLVISHGVLQYDLDSPESHIEGLVRLSKRGGLISILTKGMGGAIDRLQAENRSKEELDTLKETGYFRNNLGEQVVALQYPEIEASLLRAGAKVLDFAGVRIDSEDDHRDWRKVEYVELNGILSSEYVKSRKEHLKHRGQMLHVIAQRGE